MFTNKIHTVWLSFVLVTVCALGAAAQSTATLQGRVTNESGAAVPGTTVTVRHRGTGLERTAVTDEAGNYQVPALPPGTYRVEVQARGFNRHAAGDVLLEVSKITVQNFELNVGDLTQMVEVSADNAVVETATITVGQVTNQKTVQEIPLNGRHFVDLGLLIPGSVTPPQSGFLSVPVRGQGAFAFNTAGAREDTVNFMINGINLNDMVQNQITFQPSINTVSEFKVDNSTFSAEFGRNSGAVVNIATRSGSSQFHGEAFNFLRNDVFDARNFFDRCPSTDPNCKGGGRPPFKRNNFGAAAGGPLTKKMFFFVTYEALRQRQGLTLNSGVLSDAERTQTTDPIIRRLIDLLPRANATVNGARFFGSATAPVDLDQWTGDLSYNLSARDQLHAYYAFQRDLRGEPNLQGNTVPGFGDTRNSHRQILTINETRSLGSLMVNEFRLGFNRILINFRPNARLNPAELGINNGINRALALPQITITSLGLNFGGPSAFPQGRGDATVVVSDTLSYLRGSHSFKFGGEWRRFYNNNFSNNGGTFTFANVADFLKGNGNGFTVTLGDITSAIATGALGGFAQDSYKVRPNLTLELGVRYDWFTSPSERYDRFVVFDKATGSLVRVGSAGRGLIYEQNNRNLQPRLGFAWDPFKSGKTSIRGGYSILADQPVTNIVSATASNPPLATPLTFTGAIRLDNALTLARSAGLAPSSVDPNFRNPYVQSYNLNVQREITRTLGVMLGYFGSKATHLRISRNVNQFINGVRPFPTIAATSTILPGAAVGNITEITSAANANYNALWLSANKRLGRGLQFNASYTWSKSIDYNSLNSQGIVVQNSFDLRNNRGLSDYDARHRFVINWIYELPFKGNRLYDGWQLAGITQVQTGNPITILTNLNTFTGVATLRPDQTGSVRVLGTPTQWFTNTVCDPRTPALCPAGAAFTLPVATGNVFRFGSLGRNTLTGPGFSNFDFSVQKTTKITEGFRVQFRVEAFDVFNHTNFGQPNRVAVPGASNFGVISNTRFPTGDSGSSRQIQFALKLIF